MNPGGVVGVVVTRKVEGVGALKGAVNRLRSSLDGCLRNSLDRGVGKSLHSYRSGCSDKGGVKIVFISSSKLLLCYYRLVD